MDGTEMNKQAIFEAVHGICKRCPNITCDDVARILELAGCSRQEIKEFMCQEVMA
jgi:hypothetical protein